MTSGCGNITIELFGRLRISNDQGHDMTPKGAKTKGLVALLATTKRLERGRSWLTGKLWSDRGHQQSASSLRQSLLGLRKALGPHADALYSDRQIVRFDPKRVTISFDPDLGEFLEGLDIRDPEFATWVATQRAAYSGNQELGGLAFQSGAAPAPAPVSAHRNVILVPDTATNGDLRFCENLFIDNAMRTFRENLMLHVKNILPAHPAPGTLIVRVSAFPTEAGEFGLRIWVEEAELRGTIWSETKSGLPIGQSLETNSVWMRMVNRLTEAVSDAMSGHNLNLPFDRDANLLANIAVRKLFTIGQNEIETADRLFSQAYEIEPRGVFQAWRAQLFTIQYVERYGSDPEVLREKSDQSCALALAADPTNSNVLAAVANARMILDKNFVGGGELAMMSVNANPANPLAWWSLSNAKQYVGAYEAAYAAAVQAQKLADGTRLKFWGDFQRSLTAAITGKTEEALRFGESSSALAPNFRPPLRYLTALYAAAGREDDARRSAAHLQRREPDFTVERMVKDADYPVSIMRKSGILDGDKLMKLIS